MTLDTDITRPRILVPLFGLIYEKLIILDARGIPLSYTVGQVGATINTLGTDRVTISYETFDLTNKTGRIWNFGVETPIDSLVSLPETATILNINQAPTTISTLGSKTVLTMPAGPTTITYRIGILGTKEHAIALILNAEQIASEIAAKGVIVNDALQMIEQAKQALQQAEFTKAEELASNATTLANHTAYMASEANLTINEVRSLIIESLNQGRTVGLSEAQKRLSEAEDQYRNGQYSSSRNLAIEAGQLAKDARSSNTAQPPSTVASPGTIFGYLPYPAEVLGIGAATLIAAVFVVLRKKRRRQGGIQPSVQKRVRNIDVSKIFTEKPNLRIDDQDVIRYLAEAGGEAFEAEIKDRFQLPRTTVWRLVKRLASEEIVQILNLRGQNLVRIHEKYESKR
jgi:uncharacterized membrane protein